MQNPIKNREITGNQPPLTEFKLICSEGQLEVPKISGGDYFLFSCSLVKHLSQDDDLYHYDFDPVLYTKLSTA